jgi:hypothetical protein
MSQEDFEKAQKQIRDARVADFKKAFSKMIATSDTAYADSNRAEKRSRSVLRDYTSEEIHRIVTRGSAIE